jgi:hypothetical protein
MNPNTPPTHPLPSPLEKLLAPIHLIDQCYGGNRQLVHRDPQNQDTDFGTGLRDTYV